MGVFFFFFKVSEWIARKRGERENIGKGGR